MAYNPDKIFEQCKKEIKEHSLYFIEDLVAYIPCNRDTFYRFFPTSSDKYEVLRGMLDENKVKTKVVIRKKLQEGNRAAELLALYRLIATDEERRYLNQQYIESKNNSKEEQPLFPDN